MRLKRRLRRLVGPANWTALTGILILVVLALAAVVPKLFAPGNPLSGDPFKRLQPPSGQHPLGTDDVGRDLYTRVVHGAGLSLRAGFEVIALAALIGIPFGFAGGYLGGWMDELIMRVSDVFMAFPYLVLAIALVAALGPSLEHASLSLALVWWAEYARLMRSEVRRVRAREYVDAAFAIGASAMRASVRHILPNCVGPLIIKATLDIGVAILTLASLSFIGLGPPPPAPEWGSMVATGRNYLFASWWYPTFPGLAIFLTVMAANLVGDSVRDFLDPRFQQ